MCKNSILVINNNEIVIEYNGKSKRISYGKIINDMNKSDFLKTKLCTDFESLFKDIMNNVYYEYIHDDNVKICFNNKDEIIFLYDINNKKVYFYYDTFWKFFETGNTVYSYKILCCIIKNLCKKYILFRNKLNIVCLDAKINKLELSAEYIQN